MSPLMKIKHFNSEDIEKDVIINKRKTPLTLSEQKYYKKNLLLILITFFAIVTIVAVYDIKYFLSEISMLSHKNQIHQDRIYSLDSSITQYKNEMSTLSATKENLNAQLSCEMTNREQTSNQLKKDNEEYSQLQKEVGQLGARLDNEKQKSNVLNEQIYRNMFGNPHMEGHGMMMDGRYNKYMDLDTMDLPYWLRKKFRIPL